MNSDENNNKEDSMTKSEEEKPSSPAMTSVNKLASSTAKSIELPMLHMSLGGVSADTLLNAPNRSLKIYEKPTTSTRTTSKSSKSSTSPTDQQQSSAHTRTKQLSRPQSSQTQQMLQQQLNLLNNSANANKQTTSTFPNIYSPSNTTKPPTPKPRANLQTANPTNLTTQPGAPIVLNMKNYLAEANLKSRGDGSKSPNRRRFEPSIAKANSSSNNANSSVITMSKVASMNKVISKIRTEPNFANQSQTNNTPQHLNSTVNLEHSIAESSNGGGSSESVSSDAGIFMPTKQVPI